MAARSGSKRRSTVRRNPAAVAAAEIPKGPRVWIAGARPRTLPLAIAPVVLGTGAALSEGSHPQVVLALLCLAVALLLQVGVNYANDYSDGVRGTDRERVGPMRLTASGAARPRTVLIVAFAFFAAAAAAGVAIVLITGLWWLLAVGAAAIVAAWFYTGGTRPYGYAGLGEVAVFVFFGLVATVGTAVVLLGYWDSQSILAGVAIGCIATAALLVNNLRDLEQDRAAGKRTLSVRIGSVPSRVLFCVLMAVPYGVLVVLVPYFPSSSLVFLTLLLAGPAALIAATGRTPREFVLALSLTGVSGLVYALGLGAAFAF